MLERKDKYRPFSNDNFEYFSMVSVIQNMISNFKSADLLLAAKLSVPNK
jgi:hypothetical protein